LRSVLGQVVKKFGAKPYYAIGHSTGGHIVLRAVRGRSDFARAVVTAPLIDFNYGAWPPGLANFTASCALALGLKGLYLPGHRYGPMLLKEQRDNRFTSDMRRWQRDRNVLENTPRLGVGGPTFGWFHAALRSMKKLSGSSAKGVACPVLMVLAGRERVVSFRAAQAYAEDTPGISQVTIREAQHEILIESDAVRAQFFAALEAFLDS
jgi:lysophospholipase